VKSFCTRLPEFSANTTGRLTERTAKWNANKEEIAKKIADNQASIDAKVKETRDRLDAKRDAHVLKLNERASTPEQKTAVEAFVTALHNGIAARRVAIDAARETFRTGTEKIRNDRKMTVEKAFTTFTASVNAALDKAKKDCDAGVAPKTVRTQTVAALKSARTALQTTIKGLEKNKASIETLKTARNAAVKKAQDDFKAALEKAKTDLKAAFPEA
jgi:hypothetical protein